MDLGNKCKQREALAKDGDVGTRTCVVKREVWSLRRVCNYLKGPSHFIMLHANTIYEIYSISPRNTSNSTSMSCIKLNERWLIHEYEQIDIDKSLYQHCKS